MVNKGLYINGVSEIRDDGRNIVMRSFNKVKGWKISTETSGVAFGLAPNRALTLIITHFVLICHFGIA